MAGVSTLNGAVRSWMPHDEVGSGPARSDRVALHVRKAIALGVAVSGLFVLAGDARASTAWSQFGQANAVARGNYGAWALVSSNTRLNPSQLRFVAVANGADAEWELYCYNPRDPVQSRFGSGLVRVRGRTVKGLPT
jgi:hypothetical protein